MHPRDDAVLAPFGRSGPTAPATSTPSRTRSGGKGGSTAVGHSLRSTGYRMLTDLLNGLERSRSRDGLLTTREGGGMANATIIERLS